MKNISILLLLLMATVICRAERNPQNGEKLFKSNCASCHKPDRKLIGPPLKGVAEKYNDEDYLTAFVQNSQEVIKSGDERAVKISKEFNNQIMTSFPQLSKEEILDILAYVDSFKKEESASTGIKIRPLPPETKKGFVPLYLKKNMGVWVFFFLGVFMLFAVLHQASLVTDIANIIRRKKTEESNERD